MIKKTLIAMLALTTTIAYADCYSEGTRVGDLQKFSRKGFFTKSWEGEIVLEGIKFKSRPDGSGGGGNVWAFSVTDSNVAKQIDQAAEQGSRVALHYCQANPLDVTRGLTYSTPYLVTRVTIQPGAK